MTGADFPASAFTSAPENAEFQFVRGLLRQRAEHPALRHGELVQLMVDKDRYAFLRRSAEETVLVVLNRAGSAPIELDLSDLKLGKVTIDSPGPITIRKL